jgi:hypothetical protein
MARLMHVDRTLKRVKSAHSADSRSTRHSVATAQFFVRLGRFAHDFGAKMAIRRILTVR